MATIEDLDNCIAKLPTVGFQDYVRAEDWNNLVECIKTAKDLIEIAVACPELDEAITKLRTVATRDLILPDDYNLKTEAIKKARDCLATLKDVSKLDEIIQKFRTVDVNDFVLTSDFNDLAQAIVVIRDLLKFSLTVVVKDSATGDPIEGASVTITYNTTTETKTTDVNGIATFYDIPIGKTVHVKVEKAGYEIYETDIEIKGDTTVEIPLTLALVQITNYWNQPYYDERCICTCVETPMSLKSWDYYLNYVVFFLIDKNGDLYAYSPLNQSNLVKVKSGVMPPNAAKGYLLSFEGKLCFTATDGYLYILNDRNFEVEKKAQVEGELRAITYYGDFVLVNGNKLIVYDRNLTKLFELSKAEWSYIKDVVVSSKNKNIYFTARGTGENGFLVCVDRSGNILFEIEKSAPADRGFELGGNFAVNKDGLAFFLWGSYKLYEPYLADLYVTKVDENGNVIGDYYIGDTYDTIYTIDYSFISVDGETVLVAKGRFTDGGCAFIYKVCDLSGSVTYTVCSTGELYDYGMGYVPPTKQLEEYPPDSKQWKEHNLVLSGYEGDPALSWAAYGWARVYREKCDFVCEQEFKPDYGNICPMRVFGVEKWGSSIVLAYETDDNGNFLRYKLLDYDITGCGSRRTPIDIPTDLDKRMCVLTKYNPFEIVGYNFKCDFFFGIVKGYFGWFESYFFEFDPVTYSVTLKASCPAPRRDYFFVCGTNKYGLIIGGEWFDPITGDFVVYDDVWRYDPEADEWQQMGNAPEPMEYGAIFAINGKVYICCYADSSWMPSSKVWEYDPETDTWTRKADFPGVPRQGSIGFSLDGKGYVVGGYDADYNEVNELWEYDPETDTWTQKATPPVFFDWEDFRAWGMDGYAIVSNGFTNYKYNRMTNSWSIDSYLIRRYIGVRGFVCLVDGEKQLFIVNDLYDSAWMFKFIKPS